MIIITNEEEARAIFGKNAKYIVKKAKILKSWMMDTSIKYEGCYESPTKPKTWEYRGKLPVPQGSCFLTEFMKHVYKPWKEANPEEVEKENADRKSRDEEFYKMRNSIFGIAGKLNLFVTWKGDDKDDCRPGTWFIYRKEDSSAPVAMMNL